MGRLSESASASLDTAVLRGWARGRSAVLVLGEVGFAEAMADLAPTSTLDPVTVPELTRLLPALPAGALIVVSGSGSGRYPLVRAIVRRAPVPLTVLWHGYAGRFRHHRIEAILAPARLVSGWAVFEVAAAAAVETSADH